MPAQATGPVRLVPGRARPQLPPTTAPARLDVKIPVRAGGGVMSAGHAQPLHGSDQRLQRVVGQPTRGQGRPGVYAADVTRRHPAGWRAARARASGLDRSPPPACCRPGPPLQALCLMAPDAPVRSGLQAVLIQTHLGSSRVNRLCPSRAEASRAKSTSTGGFGFQPEWATVAGCSVHGAARDSKASVCRQVQPVLAAWFQFVGMLTPLFAKFHVSAFREPSRKALPPTFSSPEFRAALGMFATGVTIVIAARSAWRTGRPDGQPVQPGVAGAAAGAVECRARPARWPPSAPARMLRHQHPLRL